MKYVITLVHGNRPKANGRLASGSLLRRELENQLCSAGPAEAGHHDPNVTFREFAWPGTNTHAARSEAGDRLARFIRDGHEQHAEARHFIVAHSHGGNVALYAMRDPGARKIVNGIVTLGTPFIHARRRDPRRYADVIAWLILLVAALVPLMVFDALGLRSAAVVTLLGAPFLILTMKPRVTQWLTETATREQDDVVAALQPPAIDRARLAILCADGDEAGRWLRIWKLVAEAPVAIACVLLSIVSGTVRFNLPIAIDQLATSTGLHGLDEMRAFGFDGWALSSGVMVLSLIWVGVLMVSSVVRRPGYWREPLLANVLVEISTSTVPSPSGHDCHQAYFFDVARETGWGWIPGRQLRHSAICDDASVVSAIGNWIGSLSEIRSASDWQPRCYV
jgi:hypothetical protein